MAISITGLAAGGFSYSGSGNSAAFTETANELVFVGISTSGNGPFSVPTKTGLTFSLITSLDYVDQDTGNRNISVWGARAGASPSSGACTIYGDTTHTRYSIIEATGTKSGILGDALGTAVTGEQGGANPSVQLVITLSALESSDSAAVGFFGNYNYSAVTPGSGFAELYDGTQNNAGLQVEWAANDTTVEGTTVTAYTDLVGIAFEIKAPSVAATVIPVLMNQYRFRRN